MLMNGKGVDLSRLKSAGISYAAAHSQLLTPEVMKDLKDYIEANNLTPLQAARHAYYLGLMAGHPEAMEDFRAF